MSLGKSLMRRGDTLIEVMFAIAVFALVAILSIAMMNRGIASAERSLEIVTARSELNAQAEALRFIHSSYTAELALPECSAVASGEKCQQFRSLWKAIIGGAKEPYNSSDPSNIDNFSIPSPLNDCDEVYRDNNKILAENNAFVINTREINYYNDTLMGDSALVSTSNIAARTLFRPAVLNARLVYVRSGADYINDNEATIGGTDSSADVLTDIDPLAYRNIGAVEGIWVVAVKSQDRNAAGEPTFYDFYIQTCWYGSGSKTPTSLDTIIRLYNSEGV